MADLPPTSGPLIDSGSAFGGVGSALIGTCWSFWPPVTILLVARIYLRLQKTKGVDRQAFLDCALYLAIFAYLCASVSVSSLTVAIYHGYGNYSANVSLEYFFLKSKYLIVATFFSQIASAFGKASVASFLMAMQGRAHRRSGWLLYFLASTTVAINLTLAFLLMFLCDPPEPVWRGNPDPRKCHVPTTVSYRFNVFQCVWNALVDLILALYPSYIIYHLQMSRRIRILLCVLMGLGLWASAFSFVRLYALAKINLGERQNPTVILLSVWTTVEMWVVLLTLSIPPVWPLIKPYIPIGTSHSSSYKKHANASPNNHSGGSGSNGHSHPSAPPTYVPTTTKTGHSSRAPSTTSNAWYTGTTGAEEMETLPNGNTPSSPPRISRPGHASPTQRHQTPSDDSETLPLTDPGQIQVTHEVTVMAPPEAPADPNVKRKPHWPLGLQEV